jgi:hypothetical protein
MHKIIEYRIIAEEKYDDFVIQINEAIKLGWQPYFAPFLEDGYKTGDTVKVTLYHQPMVRYKD